VTVGDRFGSVGVVIGATVDAADHGIRLDAMAAPPATPILAPGFGHQGAAFSELRRRYGPASGSAIATSSRGVLGAGPDGLAEALARAAGDLAECLA
jgi:orotidine-5'-phosphate decarboxylase